MKDIYRKQGMRNLIVTIVEILYNDEFLVV